MKTNPRIAALAKFLHQESGDESETYYREAMRITTYDKCLVQSDTSVNASEYLVLTSKEADKRVAQYVKDSVWAFNKEFIAKHSKISYDATIKVVAALQEQSEGANDDITALIKNMKKFVAAAIDGEESGRGHFLSGYDGQEHEVKSGGKNWYIYRVN